MADIGCDTQLLRQAQAAAEDLLSRDPKLSTCPATAEQVKRLFTQKGDSLN